MNRNRVMLAMWAWAAAGSSAWAFGINEIKKAAQGAVDTAHGEADRLARQAQEARDRALKEANEAARRAAEAARQAAEAARRQAAEIARLRDEVHAVLDRFHHLQQDAEKWQADLRKYERMAGASNPQQYEEAIRQLRKAGVLKTNAAQVKTGLQNGLALVIWSKEFDHIEEMRFGTALGTSVATGNPAPALQYVGQFAKDSLAEVTRNLKHAPEHARMKVAKEFDKLFVQALDRARSGKAPVAVQFEGVEVTVGIATYNHWVDVQLSVPELVRGRVVLGVQLYDIKVVSRVVKVPLPNTFQPFARVVLKHK